jgi:hypothetical protein
MRREGLSASQLNQAKALYAPFFRWAKRRGMTLHNPMLDFEMPTRHLPVQGTHPL